MFDQVYLHEAAHAMMVDAGIIDLLHQLPEDRGQVMIEEMLAWFMERHGIEIIDAVSASLDRPVCVSGICLNRIGDV